MVWALALRTRQDARHLFELVRSDRRAFDSLWYMAFPPPAPGCDIDAILAGDAR